MILGQPARDFWQVRPREFWWLLDAKKDEAERISAKVGKATWKPGEVKALRKWMDAHNGAASS